MQRNIFSPRVEGVEGVEEDRLSVFFRKSAQVVLMVVFAVLPLFFIPGVYTSLGFMKSFLMTIGVYAALVFACLAMLRSGKVRVHVPLPLLLFFTFVAVGIASALLRGDVHDSIFGSSFGVQSAGFWLLLAAVMVASMVFTGAKNNLNRLFLLFCGVSIIVYTYAFIRIFGTPDFLSFGVFTSNTEFPLGTLNDLAIYAGLVVLTILVVAQREIRNKSAMVFMFALAMASLLVLMIANFSFIWLVTGGASLLTFLYLVSKDTWLKPASLALVERPVSRFTLSLVALIFLVSGAFIVSGDFIGAKVSALSGVSYLEVRPSVVATIDITRNVYTTNALLGTGPNRFEDAWRQFKNPVINETQLWNTSFKSGSSFISTLMVTTGFAGTLAFLGFLLSLGLLIYRLLFVITLPDANWRFLAKLAGVATVYFWLVALVYSGGVFIMLSTAVVTGLTLAISASALNVPVRHIDVRNSRQFGFIFIAVVLVCIVGATLGLMAVNKQFIAETMQASAAMRFSTDQNIARYDQALGEVSKFNTGDDYPAVLRAQIRLAELNRLLNIAEPSQAEREQFEAALREGVEQAESAILRDVTNPFNHALLGALYGVVSESTVPGIKERRDQAFNTARDLDPTNPEYPALQAQIAARFGEIDAARAYLAEAISLKNNYIDALFLLSQLDIQSGNATSAIATTRSIIAIDANNPARYYQLGLLEVAVNNLDAAVEAFEVAIALDTNFANARYLLALAYLDQGRTDEALAQLRTVEISNADNEALTDLIQQVVAGTYVNTPLGLSVPVSEPQITTQTNDSTVTRELPDTNLVSPVNQPPREAPSQATSTTSQGGVE